MILSTLCYLEKDGRFLMLHRNKGKKADVNDGKWIGVGGKFLPGESPEECLCREVREETGYILDEFRLRGILTFASVGWEDEYIFVYTAGGFHGDQTECAEGELNWVAFEDIYSLNLWEGDRLFLHLLTEGAPMFSLKLSYEGDALVESELILHESGAGDDSGTEEDSLKDHVEVKTFGNFDVYVDGALVAFKRSKSKEVLAYLVDRNGRFVSRKDLFYAIWEEGDYDRRSQKLLDNVIRSMRQTLSLYGIEGICEMDRGNLRVLPERISCDFYQYLKGDVYAINSFMGEYMSAYSWANMTESYLANK